MSNGFGMLQNNLHKVHNEIFIIDNFCENYIKLKNIINNNSDKYTYHEGDCAYLYGWRNEDNHKVYGDDIDSQLISDYCSFIKFNIDNIFSTNVKNKYSLDAIIYPVGGKKGPHTDSFHRDENGKLHEIHIYSSTHFIEEPEKGGELYFPEFNIKIESKKNRIVLFKCTYLHEVLEVTAGAKISINYFWETT